MSKTLSFVRFNPYTDLKIRELMNITGQNKSVVIRTLVDKSIDILTDSEGNWKFQDAKTQNRKGK